MAEGELRTLIESTNYRASDDSRLTVLAEFKDSEVRNRMVMCACDCGNFNLFKVKIQLTRNSCGCLVKESIDKLVKLVKKEEGVSAFNEVYASYQKVAAKRGYPFDISREDFKLITSKNCFYCNSPPSNKMERAASNGVFVYSGMDRVDNSKGYDINNVVPCCAVCNGMKMAMTTDEFILHLQVMLSRYDIWKRVS